MTGYACPRCHREFDDADDCRAHIRRCRAVMNDERYHVIPAIGGGWAVKRPNAKRASRRFWRKARAVDWARRRSREVVLHDRDGTIQGIIKC